MGKSNNNYVTDVTLKSPSCSLKAILQFFHRFSLDLSYLTPPQPILHPTFPISHFFLRGLRCLSPFCVRLCFCRSAGDRIKSQSSLINDFRGSRRLFVRQKKERIKKKRKEKRKENKKKKEEQARAGK